MLQILRNKSQSIFIQIIVVIIALVFIFWGVGSSFMDNSEAALVVDGHEVSFQEYQKAYKQGYDKMNKKFGGNISADLADSFGLKDEVINQLVQTVLLREGGRDMGINLSDIEIKNAITSISQFHKDGVFNPETYDEVLIANRLNSTKFESNMRIDLLSDKTTKLISSFANTVTEFEINDFYAQVNEGVSVEYIKVSPELFADKVKVNQEELEKWFSTAAAQYKAAPEVKLSYLDYSYASIGEKIAIDEPSITNYYQENLAEFTSTPRRHARHILFIIDENDNEDSKKEKLTKAEKVLIRAKAGEDFAALALEFSDGPTKTNGGDLGFFSKGEMIPIFDEVVFTMKPTEVSDIVTSQFGYHIIKLEEIQEELVTPMAEAKEEISQILKHKQAEKIAMQMANNAYEGIIGSGSIASYIKEHPEAPFKESVYFSKTTAPAIFKNDAKLLDTAFTLKAKELSSMLKTNDGYAILYIEDIKEAQNPKLESVQEQATADYKKELAKKMAKDSAEKILADLAIEGADINELAVIIGAKVDKTDFLTRQGESAEFPRSLIDGLFILSPKNKLPATVASDGEDLYVYSYLGRKDPETLTNEKEIERYRSGIILNKQQQLLSAWLFSQQNNIEFTKHPSL
ncbi:MAG: SurA N-terminal domain-containing protein [Desulfotalea sp.]